MKLPARHAKLDPNAQPELGELASRVGQFIEYWGFKSAQGRMWCYLFVSKTPLSSVDLARILGISPALVTQSAQVLLAYRVILPADKGKNGLLRFQANPNVAEAIAGVLSARETLMLKSVGDAVRKAQSSSTPAPKNGIEIHPERLRQIGQWVALAQWMLDAWVQSLVSPKNVFSDRDGNLGAQEVLRVIGDAFQER